MKLSCAFFLIFLACTPTTETKRAAPPESNPPAQMANAAVETTAFKTAPALPPVIAEQPQRAQPVPQLSKTVAPHPKTPPKTAPMEAVSPAEPATTTSSAPPSSPAPSHAAWDALLQQAVNEDGKVNYKTFKKNKAALEAYLKTLSDNPPQDDWSRTEKMAYWINAYNAFTVHIIAENYPTTSILKLDGGKTWDVKRIFLGDKKYSLNQIENDILRPQFKDARIHFALNCAAKSCPPLYNRAFVAESLETTLETRTKAFLHNPQYNTMTASKASISKIFEWYAVDFGDLQTFLNRYADTPLKNGAAIVYQEYNWDLNDQRD